MAAVPSPAAPSHDPPARSDAAPRQAPAPDERPDLRLVGPVRHRARFALAVTLLTVLAVFGIVSLQALAAEAAFEAASLEAEVAELSDRQEELTVEIARLESLDRIRDVAISDLGMVPAEQPAYLVLDGHAPHLDGPAGSRLADPLPEPPAGG